LIVAPISGRDLFTDAEVARAQIDAAVAYAARLGARCISLTGLIPAATDLGLAVTRLDGVELTTGHAATAASMGLTIEAVASAAGRDLHQAQMCFVGLGAIGTATLRTVLGCLDHPAALLLCDVPAKRGHIEALAHEATTVLGFGGEIIFAEATGGLPDFAYHADLFVGATNVTDVIDVARLKPGAIIVDDSFPLCFDLEAAIRRIESAGDILFVNGGSIRLNEELHWNCALPAGTPAVSRSFLSQALLPSSEMITGCILSALLPQAGDFRPTIGAVTLEHCRDYWRGFGHLGIAAAPLHCGAWSPKSADLDRFRSSVRQISRTARRKSPRVR